MKIEIKLDYAQIKQIEQAAIASALETMEIVYTDLVNSGTMPFDTGDMQNNQTFVESTDNGAVLITGSPQARRLYYHPEYNFQRGKNANAGAYWLDQYIRGNNQEFVLTEFAEVYKRRAGL